MADTYHQRRVTLGFCALACLTGAIICCTTFYRPPKPLPVYSAFWVQQICADFEIDPSDEFCVNETLQNPDTFEAMLERNYPSGVTTYDDIMSRFDIIFARASTSYWRMQHHDLITVFCPPDNQDSIYSCAFVFKEEIGPLYVYFETPSNRVLRYGVQRPSGS
jgi:hypothetical protein